MNKYLVKIPYSYIQFGNLTGYVYAEDDEIALDIARDTYNVQRENFINKYDIQDNTGTKVLPI